MSRHNDKKQIIEEEIEPLLEEIEEDFRKSLAKMSVLDLFTLSRKISKAFEKRNVELVLQA